MASKVPDEPELPSSGRLSLSLDRQTIGWFLGIAGVGAAGAAGGGGLAGVFDPNHEDLYDRLRAVERNQIRICVELKVDCDSE